MAGTTYGYYYNGQYVVNETKKAGTGASVNYASNVIGVGGIIGRYGTQDGYYLKDAHGDVLGAYGTDGTTKLADYTYDAWGNQTSASASSWAEENPIRYAGEYYDTESGLIYLRARYYDSGMERFISEDPHWNTSNMIYDDNTVSIANILQSSNLYSYCLNNPLLYSDPTGNIVISTAVLVGISVGALIGAAVGAYVGYQTAQRLGISENDSWKFVAGYGLGGAIVGGVIGAVIGYGVYAALGLAGAGVTSMQAVADAIARVTENTANHILNGSKGNDHLWRQVVDNVNWETVKGVVNYAMNKGKTELVNKYVNDGVTSLVYKATCKYKGKMIEVYYAVTDGIIKISDAYVQK